MVGGVERQKELGTFIQQRYPAFASTEVGKTGFSFSLS